MPNVLDETHPLLSQETLDATDRVSLAIEKMANAAQEIEIVRSVVTATAAAFHRPDLAETTFPEAQYVLWNFQLLRHFADGPECSRCLLHRHSAPSSIETLFWQAGFSVDALLEDGGRLEDHHASRGNRHLLAGLRIAPDSLPLLTNHERTER